MSPRASAAVLFAVVVLGSSSLVSRSPEAPPLISDLVRLIETQGVTGYEDEVRHLVERALPKWAVPRVDEIGNLVVTIGKGAPHTLVTTSLDEDGYVVSAITADGYLRLHRVSSGATYRLLDQYAYGQPIVIHSFQGRHVAGVTGTASTHLLRGMQVSTTPKGLDDLYVDVGAEKPADVASLDVRMLDPVNLRERAQALAGGRVTGVAAQARANTLALLAVVAGLDRPPVVSGTVTLAWTTQGLVGERGLARLAQAVSPDRVVVLSRTPVGREGDSRGAVGVMGGGVIAPDGDAFVSAAAQQAGVRIQQGAALKAPQVFQDRAVSTVAIPILFAQTPVEAVDITDVAALARLLRAAAAIKDAAPASPGAGLLPPAARPGPAPGAAPGTVESAVFRTAGPLVEAYGVSGHDAGVRDLVARQLPQWARPRVDDRGNLVVSFGKGGRELLFVAHTDEIGYEITSVAADGTATVRKRGGFFDSLLEAHPVLVHASGGQVPAIVAPRPGYTGSGEWLPKAEEVRLYFGTDSKAGTEALSVAVGDTATVRKTFTRLYGQRATGRAVDDRAGCAVLIEALKRIDPAAVPNRVTFAWVGGEETGLEGSRALAATSHPVFAFAIDTFVSSDSPLDSKRMAHIPLGSGAVLRGIDGASITPAAAITQLHSLAVKHGIPVSIGATGGGTDASSFTRYGSIPMPLSWPGRYSHSPVEVVDARDLEALIRLVVTFAGAL